MRAPVALCLALSLLTLPASAATFTMISQNTLHYGWNQGGATRNQTFRDIFSGAQVIVVQELMDPARIGELSPLFGYTFSTSVLLGRSSYKEAYGFIVSSALHPQPAVTFGDPSGNFSRPPSFVLLQPGGGTQNTWIGNVHIIFGQNGVTGRLQEVQAIPGAVTAVTGNNARVVIGGDWNLDAATLGTGVPDVPTTVNVFGGRVSNYDHFVPLNVAIHNADYIDPTQLPHPITLFDWRQTISDHLGIACHVDY